MADLTGHVGIPLKHILSYLTKAMQDYFRFDLANSHSATGDSPSASFSVHPHILACRLRLRTRLLSVACCYFFGFLHLFKVLHFVTSMWDCAFCYQVHATGYGLPFNTFSEPYD